MTSLSRRRQNIPQVLRGMFACVKSTLVLLTALVFSFTALASVDERGYDEHTIRASDFPAVAPQFEQYRTIKAFKGHVAPADVKTHPLARLFRTAISEGAKRGPDFAGHYTVVWWGCGTDCRALAIVDANTGKVHFPSNLSNVDNINIAYEEFEPPDGRLVKYRLESRLLIVIGGINEEPARRGVSYFVWSGERLRRIMFVPKPYGENAD